MRDAEMTRARGRRGVKHPAIVASAAAAIINGNQHLTRAYATTISQHQMAKMAKIDGMKKSAINVTALAYRQSGSIRR